MSSPLSRDDNIDDSDDDNSVTDNDVIVMIELVFGSHRRADSRWFVHI